MAQSEAVAGGLGERRRCVHMAPSHSQVSLADGKLPLYRTVRARAESYANACPPRAGGLLAGARCVQLVPSHSHVSPKALAPMPPNSTTRARAASKTIACCHLRDGLTAGAFSTQARPSHSQVSAEPGL